MTHTKGPWYEIRDDDYVYGADGKAVALPLADLGDFKTVEANARLIAAAPEMLEALQNIENDDGHMPASAWRLIQTAINKATGES